jgi:hypothetical protein
MKMDKNEKTLRDRLLNVESNDSISGKILKQSLLESEGRLTMRKRVESWILMVAGGLVTSLLIVSLRLHYLNWWYKELDNVLTIAEVAGIALGILWMAVTGWEAQTGRCNDRWHPALKAIGVAGTMFMLAVTGFWWLFVPATVGAVKAQTIEARSIYEGTLNMLYAIFFGIIPLLLLCMAGILAVYWRICRQGARMNEKMIETQCMIAELQEKLCEKKP